MNKRIALTILLLFTTTLYAKAQSPEALQFFDEGNISFREGRYSDAVAAYDSTLATGYESAALHYNLGTAYYRLDQLGMAVLHLEKAATLNPDIPELQHSLTLVRSLRADQFSRVPDPFWKPVFDRLIRFASPAAYFFSGFAFYLVTLALVGLILAGRPRSNWLRRTILGCATAGTFLLATAFALSIHSQSEIRYVLVGDVADVLVNPDELSDRQTRIHEGAVFEYLGETDGWLHIKLPNGVDGWVVNENAIRI